MARAALIAVTWTAIVLLAVGVFLPWQTIEWDYDARINGQVIDFTSDSHAQPWGERSVIELNGQEERDSGTWLSPVHEAFEELGHELKGLTWLRITAVLFLLGSLAGLTGAILTTTMRSKAGSIVMACAGFVAIAMLVTLLIGHAGYYETMQAVDADVGAMARANGGSYDSHTGHPVGVGLFVGIAGIATMLAAALMGLLRKETPSSYAAGSSGHAGGDDPVAYGAPDHTGHNHSPFAPATRKLRCPKCQAVNAIPEGMKPSCTRCGFGA